MNQEIKQKWVAALRSGEYKQGQGELNGDGGYCCLGVLCDLHAKATGGNWNRFPDVGNRAMQYLDEAYTLPNPVMEWAGLPDNSPSCKLETNGGETYVELAELNDGNERTNIVVHSFAQISDIIEKHL